MKWTLKETQILHKAIEEYNDISIVARILNRSYNSVYKKLDLLGYKTKTIFYK